MTTPEADSVASPPEPDEWVDSPGPGSEVSRSHWMPEEAFKRCTNPACGKEFTQRRRKHHCRCCGNVYCSKCTSYVLPLNPLSAMIEAGGVKAKVCELCYERAVDEGYAESTGSQGDAEADGSVHGAQGYLGAESPADAPADSHTHASAAKSGPSGLTAEQATSPNSILSSSPSSSAATPAAATANSSDGSSSASAPPRSSFDSSIPRPSSAGPSTLSDRLSHARPPSSLEEDIFGARPRLRAAMLEDHRPHSSGGRVASSAFPRFNSISGAGNALGSGTGGAGGRGSGSISIGGVGMGGGLRGSGGSGDLFQRSTTLSASHERAIRGQVKSVQLHDLLAAWEKGESVLDSTTTTVSPLPATSPLPTAAPLPAGSPLPTTASPLTLLATISHRMGLAPAPPSPATALEQRHEGRGEKGHKEAAEAAAAGGTGKGPSAEAIQRLLWTDGEPTAVPASAAAAAPDTAATADPAAAAASPGDTSPQGRGEALDEVKRSLAASMGAAGGGGEGRTAAASGASSAPHEPSTTEAKAPGAVAPGASGGAAAAPSASAVRAAPASLLQWSSSDVLHWLRSSVPFRSAPASHYAADFEKAGVEGITLMGMTRGHPALANMRPADLVAFEMASQVERRRVVAAHATGQPTPELAPRPATAVGVTGMDSQHLRPGQAGQQQQQQQAKLVPPRQFRALHLDGFSSASSRATTPADTPHSTDSRILNPVPARPATAAAGSGGGGGQKKGAGSSGSGGGWLFGWSSSAAKDSPASAEGGEARDEVAAAEEREQTAKAKLSHLDAMLKRSLLVEYLHTRQRWAPIGGEGPLPVDDPEAEDEWLPRFVALSANEVSCYRQASDLDPEVSIPLDSVAAAGTLEAGGEAGEEAEDWLVFHLTTGYGLRLECGTRSRVKLQLWLATIHEAVENLLDFLPFKCDACHQPFCLDHRSYGAHECPDVHIKDVTVAVCPKCSSSFRTSRFEDAERALARHMGGSDCQAASAERRTKCPVRGCRQRLTTSNRAKCRSCAEDHCLQHRLASDHHCAHRATSSATRPTRAEGKGAGQRFLDALAKRTGGECAQSSSSGSSSDSTNAGVGVNPSVKAH
ncbi:unnamed protein product [Closterium sp. Yama58-4]|nr:unnamed protein product [Closterium sp. Yama58-4]